MIHAPKTEARFKMLLEKAQEIGMKVNDKKTQLLCISGRKDSDSNAYIRTVSTQIQSTSKLKILGFTFGRDPGPSAHVSTIEASFRKKVWTLRNLKKAKLEMKDIVDIYYFPPH